MLKGTSILRENNKRKVLSLVRSLKQTTRKDLEKKMNVSKNTISLVVDELIQDGVIEEIGVTEPNKKGRPKILIQIKPNSFKSVGITVSKRAIDYTIINYDGQLLEENTIANDGTDAEKTIRRMMELLESIQHKYEKIIGVGIGIPGIINEEELKVPISTHLHWKNVSLQSFADFPIPVTIQNSVNMGAHSAIHDELLADDKSIFYVRVSEGVGGAFILDDVAMPGHTWNAGEIGHISVDPAANTCRCGQNGCLESLINIDEFKNELSKNDIRMTEENGYFFPQEESQAIDSISSKYGSYLGKSLVAVMHLLNPKTIIIDTPYNYLPSFKEECLHTLETRCLDRVYKGTTIIFGKKRYNMSRGAALSTIINYEKHVY